MVKVVVDGRVLSHARMSGVERYVVEICRALQDVGSNHSFVLAKPPSGSKILRHAWEHFALPVQCLKEKADLLFCPANIAPLFRPRRIRLVVTIHGLAFRHYPQAYTKGFNFYYSHLLPRVLRRADAIVAVSGAEKNSILDQYGWMDHEKIYIVHSGINHEMFRVGRRDNAKEILRNRFGITGKFVLAVGSQTAVKNFRRLVEAFLQIANGAGVNLVLVCGAGPFRYERGGNAKHSRVRLLHNVGNELPLFYQAAEMIVVPSQYEGFGFPALEAMACGCPVVVSNVAALPEVCSDAAYYIDPNDSDSIAAGIEKVLTDENLRQDLIKRGLHRASNFTWEKTARETLKVFDAVMNERGAVR